MGFIGGIYWGSNCYCGELNSKEIFGITMVRIPLKFDNQICKSRPKVSDEINVT